jgi:hypothetical protein
MGGLLEGWLAVLRQRRRSLRVRAGVEIVVEGGRVGVRVLFSIGTCTRVWFTGMNVNLILIGGA